MEPLRKSRLLLGTLAGVLLFQFALMLAMSAWSPLHQQLHGDAGHSDHQCEVTLWQSGSVTSAPAAPVLPQPVASSELPDVRVARAPLALTATHLLGGVMAQGPPRGP